MRKHCCVVVFLVIFFSIFAVCDAFGERYDKKDILPEPDYTEEIVVVCVVLLVVTMVAIDAARKKKLPKQIQKKNLLRNTNFDPYIQFGIHSPVTQEKKHMTTASFKVGMRF